jgi:hypothetical protein
MMGLLMEGVRGNNSSTTANPTMMQLDMKHVSGRSPMQRCCQSFVLDSIPATPISPASPGFPASTPPAQYGMVLVNQSTKMDIHQTFLASMHFG